MTDNLSEKKCQACEGKAQALDLITTKKYLSQVPEWALSKDSLSIFRKFTFKSFYPTMSFINAIAYIAQQEGHHPDVEFGYNYCTIKFTTHALNALSINDFICAAKINKII